MSHTGSCFCGSVKLEVSGAPEAMGYCHCRSCRSWSGGPVNAFSLWKPTAVRVVQGAQHVAVGLADGETGRIQLAPQACTDGVGGADDEDRQVRQIRQGLLTVRHA